MQSPDRPTELGEYQGPSPVASVEDALASPLSRFAECWLYLACTCEGRSVLFPVKLLMRERRVTTLAGVVRHLRCRHCRQRPTTVYLQEDRSRTENSGAPPGWSLPLRAD